MPSPREIFGLPPKPVGAAEDMARTAGPALERGTLGTINMGNDLGARVRNGMAWLAGITPEQLDAINQVQSNFGIGVPAKTSDVIAKAEEVHGPLYHPQTWQGDLTDRTISNGVGMLLAPGTMLNKGLSAVGGAVGGYTGREGTKKLVDALENYAPRYKDTIEKARPYVEGTADIIGSVGGSFAPNVVQKRVTPNPITPKRQRLIAELDRNGVPLTAGQKTGNTVLHAAESETGGTAYSNVVGAQKDKFTEATMRKGNVPFTPEGDLGEAFVKQHSVLGRKFDHFQGYGLVPEQTLFSDLVDIRDRYLANTNEGNRLGSVGQYVKDLSIKAMNQPQGIDGEWLKQLGSTMRNQLKELRNDPTAGPSRAAIREIIDAVDNRIEQNIASINPAEAGQFKQLRSDYRDLVTLEDAASGTGKAAAAGQITPQELSRASRNAEGKNRFAQGKGKFTRMSRAGAVLMNDAPNSGTTSRFKAAFQGLGSVANLPTVIGYGAGSLVGFPGAGAAIGAGIHAGIKGINNIARMSPAMQAYLANQVASGWKPGIGASGRAATIGATNLPRIDEERR